MSPGVFGFGHGDGDVAAIDRLVSEAFEICLQDGYAQAGHVERLRAGATILVLNAI